MLRYFYLTFFHPIHVGFIVQCSVIVREKNVFSHVHSACLKYSFKVCFGFVGPVRFLFSLAFYTNLTVNKTEDFIA